MGNKNGKNKKSKEDLDNILFQMKINSKKFSKESNKANIEKQKALVQAKKCLKTGDEEGAKLFIQQAGQKGKDSKKFLQMSHKFDYIYNQIKTQNSTKNMTNDLTKIGIHLKNSNENMNCDQLTNNLNNFNKNFDNFKIQDRIINEHFNNNMNVNNIEVDDKILNSLKNEVNYKMANKLNTNYNPISDDNAKADDFYNDLKHSS